MIDFGLFANNIKNIAVLCVLAYVITQLPPLRRALHQVRYGTRDKAMLMVTFGLLSALGNFLSIPMLGAIAHTRMVGAVVGGLVGGPLVGLGAGIIGSIPRWFIGGDFMYPAIGANILVGYLSGLVCVRYGARQINLTIGFWCSIASEVILKGMILTLSPSFEAALELERVIAIPTTIANTLGVMLFLYIIREVFREQERLQAQAAQQAMRVIRKVSGLLREGLTEQSARKIGTILFDEMGPAAVAITDREHVLAFIGCGADHHRVGDRILTDSTQQALRQQRTIIVNDRNEIGCPVAECPLAAVISAPLVVNGETCGAVKLYKTQGVVLPYEGEITQGIADFLSLQLLQAELDAQTMLLAQAEYNSLRAQIHPHFIFNVLSTIRAVVLTNPQQARTLIMNLSELLRQHISHGKESIAVGEELECVDHYVRLEEARFGDRIKVVKRVEPAVLQQQIPVFSIQILVENAIKHGLSPKKQGGTVQMAVWREGAALMVKVEDDGVGIQPERLREITVAGRPGGDRTGTGLGLKNVHARIQRMYGNHYGITLESGMERPGTTVTICLPWGETGGRREDAGN